MIKLEVYARKILADRSTILPCLSKIFNDRNELKQINQYYPNSSKWVFFPRKQPWVNRRATSDDQYRCAENTKQRGIRIKRRTGEFFSRKMWLNEPRKCFPEQAQLPFHSSDHTLRRKTTALSGALQEVGRILVASPKVLIKLLPMKRYAILPAKKAVAVSKVVVHAWAWSHGLKGFRVATAKRFPYKTTFYARPVKKESHLLNTWSFNVTSRYIWPHRRDTSKDCPSKNEPQKRSSEKACSLSGQLF